MTTNYLHDRLAELRLLDEDPKILARRDRQCPELTRLIMARAAFYAEIPPAPTIDPSVAAGQIAIGMTLEQQQQQDSGHTQ